MIRKTILLFCLLAGIQCTSNDQSSMNEKKVPNQLINSTSPYLLQHAYNPVDWYPWGEEALEKAKREDKPILVSIGYSSCHWCHVMERESFENDSIADIMNELFVAIKVDREERPDIDQIYMDAVTAMGINGGWPLNVFLTPDQEPFYGGTYFPKDTWGKLLGSISNAFETRREEIEKSAKDLTNLLQTSPVAKYNLSPSSEGFSRGYLDECLPIMVNRFDREKGGFKETQKFPLPNNWLMLLRVAHEEDNTSIKQQVFKTLDEMAAGGIYDQIGGGFARYSVDPNWLVPHFEKMLYDNAQLITLYSEAYNLSGKERYKEIVYETVEWLEREMKNDGGYYAALDADSEGEEGKFYVWTADEIDKVLKEKAGLAKTYYNVWDSGNWEHGKNILHTTALEKSFHDSLGLKQAEWRATLNEINHALLEERAKRVRPGLDDKILSGWNGLLLKGFCDAYRAFQDDKFLELALENAQFIEDNLMKDGVLFRSFKDNSVLHFGYLEDYASVIEGYIALYQISFDEHWLELAKSLTDYTLENFNDEKDPLLYYTDTTSSSLIARKKELFDNVQPSSNSIMATNLYFLGIVYDNSDYSEKSANMMKYVQDRLKTDLSYLTNWAILYQYMASPTAEIVLAVTDPKPVNKELLTHYHPNKIVMATDGTSELPLTAYKEQLNDKPTLYVCYNKTCKLPVNSVDEALKQLQ